MFTEEFPKDFSEYKKDISLRGGVPKQFYEFRNKKFLDWEIPPWELLIYKKKCLGSGSFADVYLAKWRETIVVAKIFNNYTLENKKFLIEREIDIMTKMHHPNITQILGFCEEPFILVMEYIPKGDLLVNLKKLTRKEKFKIMINCLQAIAYIHNRQPESLIHRDIKLSNILVTNSKVAKITDFGLSKLSSNLTTNYSNNNLTNLETYNTKLLSEDNTRSVGTTRYSAPEIYSNNYDNKVDIYSLGIVFYELFEKKRYNSDIGFKWFYTKKPIRDIIQNDMVISDPNKRLSALSLLKKINLLYPNYLY